MAIAQPTSQAINTPELLRAYHDADKTFRVQQSKIGCILVLICMPLGLGLDWFVYPQYVLTFFLFGRILCDVAVLPLFLLLRGAGADRRVAWIGLAWPALPAVAISWMIYMSEGSRSPYYAGLILVLIVACQLMPYTLREATVVCGMTLFTYLVACVAHSAATGVGVDTSILFNNVYFISITALICVCSSHFSTDRRIKEFALRRELDQRNRELAELDRLKSEFFANVSHELRTPLTLIIAPTDRVLADPDLPAAIAKPLEVVRQNALRLLKLITDLLEIVRLDEKTGERNLEPLDLTRFVRATVESMQQLAEQKHLRLQCAGTNDPMVIHADGSRLEKIVMNLMTNAIKFTPVGGAVTVDLRRERDEAIIDFADTGIGIPAKDLPHVFERFRQADGSATRKYQGVGIGLALARELVLEHGGTLTVTSEEGRGTTFRLRFPLAGQIVVQQEGSAPNEDAIVAMYREADRTIAPVHTPLDWDELSTVHGAGKFDVLVIEDEPDLREFVVSMLAQTYRVRQASDGLRGLEAVGAHRPQLVLLDLMLPDMDGLEVCRRIKGDPELRSTRVVLITARTDEESKLTGLRAGADDFVQKPFSTAELTSRIANLLKAAELEQSLRDSNTEIATAMSRLKATEVQLVQSEKANAVGRLSAGILHEVNNPLNASLMAVHVAKMKNTTPAVGECLIDIETSMKRIQAITSSLRTFAHPSDNVTAEIFTVDSLITSVEQLLAHDLNGHRIDRVHVNGVQVRGSKNQIVHVLINLVGNSLFAVRGLAGNREPRIMVGTSVDNGRVVVTVEDNGSGIASDDLGRVFDPFFTRRDVGEGMGLGLSICQTIVAAHGGTLRVESSQGEWTRMTFDLPCA